MNVNRKRPPGTWAPEAISHILHGEVYKGTRQYGKRNSRGIANPESHRISVEVPALVDAEVWEKAQKQSARNMVIGARNTKNRYLMQHRMQCALCGHRIGVVTTHHGSKAYPYYTCYGRTNAKRSADEKCQLKPFGAYDVDEAVWQWLAALLTDPEALVSGLREQQKQQEKASEPLQNRLTLVNQLIEDNTAQLNKVLDLYLAGEFTRELLSERRARLESTLASLIRERATLQEHLQAQLINKKQIRTRQSFAQQVRSSLTRAETDFQTKRELVELLEVEATLAVEDGVKVAYVTCLLGEKALSFASSATTSRWRWCDA